MARIVTAATAALLLVVAACGSSDPAPLAVIANAPGTITINGPQRMLVGLLADDAESLASEEHPASIEVFVGEPDNVLGTVAAVFTPTIPGVRGLYRFSVTFLDPGTYGIVVKADGLPDSMPAFFTVTETGVVPQVGDPAPRSVTPTSPDRILAEITSDPEPEPSFYDLSVDEAVTNGTPAVIVFSTPAWCQTATCGPTLDFVKEVAGDHPDVDFVHVEVYENLDAESFEDLILVPAASEWGLPSEPWVFVVDATGNVSASFEGAIAPEELRAALPQ